MSHEKKDSMVLLFENSIYELKIELLGVFGEKIGDIKEEVVELKTEVVELKTQVSRMGKSIESNDSKFVSNEKFEALKKDLEVIQSTHRWLMIAVGGTIVTAILKLIIDV